MNYADMVNEQKVEERRRFILMLLSGSTDYVASDKTLRSVFDKTDFQVSQVAGDLQWLKDAGVIALKAVDGVTLARLLPAGLDVVRHKRLVPGISNQDIGDWQEVSW